MSRLTRLEVFVRVVDSGSFTAAANQLQMSKSAVSQHILKLEEELSARLLNRTTRKIHLTEAGNIFYERSARILDDIADAENAVHSLHQNPRGTLRVVCPTVFGLRHLGPLLPVFNLEYPDLKLDISLTDRAVDMLEEGYDLQVNIGRHQDSSLIQRFISPCKYVMCATPSYLAQFGSPKKVEDLENHNCLLLSDTNSWYFEKNKKGTSVPVAGQLKVNNADVLRHALLGGMGIAVLPTFVLGADVKTGVVLPILEEYEPEPGSGVHVIYPENRHLSLKVRLFVEFLQKHFGEQPYWDDYLEN